MIALPAITKSSPPDRNPPTIGTEPERTYFAARRESPSYCAEVIPCTVRKMLKSPKESPTIHLLKLLNSSPSRSVRTSLERFPTNASTITATEVGKTTAVNRFVIAPLIKATAGRNIPTETEPPLAAMSVSKTG